MSDQGEPQITDGTWDPVDLDQVIELRIHGVGGTPPADMLDDPHPVQVSGDRTAGVMRSSNNESVEAYSWGGLTGRSQLRALWLLVLPFALVNLAGWMTANRERTLHQALVQLAGLAITALYVLFAAAITMDFVAFQCAGKTGCASASWPLIGKGEIAGSPGQRAVVGAIGPVLLIVALAVLTRRTRRSYEHWNQSGKLPTSGRADDPGLSNPNFWDGRAYMAGLARVHHFTGLALVALLLSTTTASTTDSTFAPALTFWIVVVLLAACGMAFFRRFRRLIPWRLLPLAGVLFVVAAGVAAWVEPQTSPPGRPPSGMLPGMLPAFAVVLLVLWASVLGLLLFVRGDKNRPCTWRQRLRERITPFAVCVLAATLAPAFLAGTALSVARLLGTASVSQPNRNGAEILYPQAYELLARSLVVLIVLAVVIALFAGLIAWCKTGKEELACLVTAWQEADSSAYSAMRDQAWMRRVRAALRIPKASLAAAEWMIWTLAVVITAGFLTYARYWTEAWLAAADKNEPPVVEVDVIPLPPLGFSVWTLYLLLGVLLIVLWQGLRNPSTRRRIAIAWDVVTFWPRAYHPLSPPSYAERAVPEMRTRVKRIWDAGGSVVLLAHSQGCVLAAAAVAGLPDGYGEDLSVVSYGNPIRRLYARHFPSYINDELFDTLDGKAGCWHNFHRDTDYVGHRMFAADDERETYLPDPATDRYLPGDQLPEIRAHGEKGYRRQSQFVKHTDAVREEL